MRKTRLVILPTKCLHQMGFLLLFLSCPVIGDWGRIRPESENSHDAIQIDREGTCGLERDPPGGLLDFLNETGSKQCRLSEDSDLNKPTRKPVFQEPFSVRKFNERRINVQRINQREPERRMSVRRDIKMDFQKDIRRDLRSRSVESRRPNYRSYLRIRSLSLSRLENERTMRERSAHRYNEGNRRKEPERLHLIRQGERRVEQQKRLNKELANERRENEIRARSAAERREREIRFTRSIERERHGARQDNNRSFQSLSTRREHDIIKSQNRERAESIRERSERRLSLARRDLQDTNKRRTEIRRNTNPINVERRLPENRKARSSEFLSTHESVRISRSSDKRDVEDRRSASLSPKIFERNVRERRVGLLNEMNGKARRGNVAIHEMNLENKNAVNKVPFGKELEGMNFKSHDAFKTGDWTNNCVVGAIVYFLTTRQIKSV